MATNIELIKNSNENNAGLLRRFSKRVKSSGVIKRVKSIRYDSRPLSKYTQKKKTLKAINKKKVTDELIKLGKISDKTATRKK